MTVSTQRCPICDTEVSSEAKECPSCGLPRDFWPEGEVEAGTPPPTTSETIERLKRAGPVGIPLTPEPGTSPDRATSPVPLPASPRESPPSPSPFLESPPKPAPAPTPAPEETSPPSPAPSLPVTPPPSPPQVTESPPEVLPAPKSPEISPTPVPEEKAAEPEPRPSPSEPVPASVPAPPKPVPPAREAPEPVPPTPPAPRHAPVAEKPEAPPTPPQPKPRPRSEAAPGTFEHAMGEVRELMGLASLYSIDIGTAATDVSKATKLYKLNEIGPAQVAMVRSAELLKKGLDMHCRKSLEGIARSLTKLGPFAPPEAVDGARLLESCLTRQDYVQFLPDSGRISRLLGEWEVKLGPTAKFISALRAIDSGIISLGGKPPETEAVLERAHGFFLGGQTAKVEALLGLTVGDALEALAPLLATRISLLTQNLKRAHEKGKDTHEVAVLLKQVTLALRSRNYLQVLGLLHRIEAKLPRETLSEQAEGEAEARPRRRIKGRSSSPPPEGTQPAGSVPHDFQMPPIRKGHSYLFLESHPRNCLLAFLETKADRPGLLVTCTFPPKVIEITPLPETEVVWISETEGWVETYHPKTLDHEISARILAFLRSDTPGALCLDGLGQLISALGADRVEKFMKLMLDVASAKTVSVVTTLAPETVDEKVLTKFKFLFDFTA